MHIFNMYVFDTTEFRNERKNKPAGQKMKFYNFNLFHDLLSYELLVHQISEEYYGTIFRYSTWKSMNIFKNIK